MSRRPLLRYIVTRFAIYLLSIWGSFTLAFIFFRMIPGDPIATFVATMQQQYSYQVQDAEAMIENYRRMLGLDGSLLEQYLRYLGNVVLRFDFGPSLISFPTPALEHIMKALPWSIGLLTVSLIIAWALGFVIGGLVGFRRNNVISSGLTNLALVMSQIPSYFLALALLFLFAYGLAWLPTRGAYSASVQRGFTPDYILSVGRHAILPGLSVVLVFFASWLISTRSLVVTILGEDYLLFAEAKGLRQGHILSRYVLRNAMLPQVTGLALTLGIAMNGFYLVEYVFNYPGVGTLFITSVGLLDYNTLQGIVLMSILVILTATLIIDLLLPLIDPRVRLGGN
jgi:peptide/nickel transport system permease protein